MEGTASVQWLPALIFLAVGLALGAGFAWASRRGKPAPKPAAPVEVRDLAGERAVLVRQLRELEDTAAKRTPEQLARERYALELALARTLRALDIEGGVAATTSASGAATTAAAPAAGAAPAGNPAVRGFLWGIGSMAAVALLFYFVTQAARPRDANAPVTGNTPRMGQQPEAPDATAARAEAEEREAEAAVKAHPDDVEARLRLTRAYLARQDMMAVFKETQEILKLRPENPQALSYQALVRLAMGQGDMALDMLKKALKADPEDIETYIHLSLVYARLGRSKEFEATMTEALERFPEQAPMLREVQQQIRQAVARASSEETGGEANPHASVAEPGTGSAAATAPSPQVAEAAPGGDRRVSGVVELDPSLVGQLAPGTVIFVFVRDSGFGAGPPIAAKRLVADSFPVHFEISSADSMRGDPIPKEILLEARADSDGDPMTHPPEDPIASIDDLKVPSNDVHLVLKRKGK
jgi:tetratricopeptide (TPR) repeat protein